MTRKEELKHRAADLASGPVSPYDVYEALAKVEREVWEKVERYYSHQIHHDMDDYPDKFVKWLKSQQQEQQT